MNTVEHLQLIRARCVELLEIADKRTAGAWRCAHKKRETGSYSIQTYYIPYIKKDSNVIAEGWESDEEKDSDFTFIAACAGAAEAGWRATITAIDGLQGYAAFTESDNASVCLIGQPAQDAINSIITAWPIELLK